MFGWRFCLQDIYVRKQRSPELLALSLKLLQTARPRVPRDQGSLESSGRLLRSRPASIAVADGRSINLMAKISVDKFRLSAAHLH